MPQAWKPSDSRQYKNTLASIMNVEEPLSKSFQKAAQLGFEHFHPMNWPGRVSNARIVFQPRSMPFAWGKWPDCNEANEAPQVPTSFSNIVCRATLSKNTQHSCTSMQVRCWKQLLGEQDEILTARTLIWLNHQRHCCDSMESDRHVSHWKPWANQEIQKLPDGQQRPFS